jgi:hypothetical protein
VPELDLKLRQQLVWLQLVVLLVVVRQLLAQIEQLVVWLLGLLVVQVYSQVQNFELVQILELGESHPLVHQLQVLWLLLELLHLELLVSMF